MRILLVDGDRSEGAVLAGQLGERGHDVVRCLPLEGNSVCVGAFDPTLCPVESLGCDVALVVREAAAIPGLREMGAVCAIRRHIPLVEVRPDGDSPYGRWSTPTGTAVVEAVEDFDSGARPGLVAAVEERLASLPAVIRLGRMPTVAIRRQGTRLLMSLTLPPDATRADEESIVTLAVRALRELDPHALTADVTTHRHL
ncbi:MAG: hypothetical protein ACKO84_06590 [Actinomycetota bacterium]